MANLVIRSRNEYFAPEKEKGGGNKIQHMNWFELLKESWQQYNVEYQNSWMIEKILEKLNRDMFWNDQLNSLLAMANNADIGVDESADMARKARQGRLGIGRPGGSRSDKEKGAWEISNNWDEKIIKLYREFAPKQAEMYKKSGKKFTCEDLALQILIDFASQNKLPLSITNDSGTYRPQDFDSIEDFTSTVLGTTGSKDLELFNNTINISFDGMLAGDLLIQQQPHGSHTQIITEMNKYWIEIYQGNTNKGLPYSNYPDSKYYIGTEINTSYFTRSNGNYFSGRNNQFYNFNKLTQFRGYSWNFNKFNR